MTHPNKRRVSFWLDPDLWAAFLDVCARQGTTASGRLREAIKGIVDQHHTIDYGALNAALYDAEVEAGLR